MEIRKSTRRWILAVVLSASALMTLSASFVSHHHGAGGSNPPWPPPSLSIR
ncbi:MAG TPA: hypothetical protein VF221_17960 [Chloroflexota bacterium]